MDTIIIQELEVHCRVGVTEQERSRPQRLQLTLEIGADFSRAAAADDLARTIDYYAVVQRLRPWGEGKSWRLIETLASEAAELILAEFKAVSVTVEVRKFIVADTRYVAVRLSRVSRSTNS